MDTTSQVLPLQDVQRRIGRATAIINFVGALVVYLYFTLVDPLPEGNEVVQALSPIGLIVFLAFILLTFTVGILWRNRSNQRIAAYHHKLNENASTGELELELRREVLHVPIMTTLRTGIMWLLAGVLFSFVLYTPRAFIGIVAIGGALTSALTYFIVETLWRPVIPLFFPQGDLSSAGAIRLPVLARLLLVILLVGLLPPLILVNLALRRAQSLLVADNPQAVLQNLFVLVIFILTASLLAGIGLSVLMTRSITNPLKTLQGAMQHVEQSDFSIQVPVTSNDELGYLSERFNQMTAGLRRGQRMQRLFGLYVSPEVARAAVENGAGLGGELVMSTILFSDLRDFTGLSESMPPDALIQLINRYMTLMVGVITGHSGIVTRFGGDSILAVFGSPLNPSARHAALAVQAALEMRRALKEFNQDQAAAGGPTLRMGVGVATGNVVAGNVGGKERIEYTLLGDATNLASRLQEKTKQLGAQILLSETTYQQASQDITLRASKLSGVTIRGKREDLTVYRLY